MADTVQVAAKDLMTGLTLRVRIPRSFSVRTKVACWLIGLAGRVLTVPCEIELATDGQIKPGDVVHDLWDARSNGRAAKVMTAHSVENGVVQCVWFEGGDVHHARLRAETLRKVDDQQPVG